MPNIAESKKTTRSEFIGSWKDKIRIAEDFTIITIDENIQKYDVAWVW